MQGCHGSGKALSVQGRLRPVPGEKMVAGKREGSDGNSSDEKSDHGRCDLETAFGVLFSDYDRNFFSTAL